MGVSLEFSDGIAVVRSRDPLDTALPHLRALVPAVVTARAVVLFVGCRLRAPDLRRLVRSSAAEREALSSSLRALCEAVARLPPPVVAAIDGSALGEAADLAMACDHRVLASDGGFGRVSGYWASGDPMGGAPAGGDPAGGGPMGGGPAGGDGVGGDLVSAGRVGAGRVGAGRVLVARRVTAAEALRTGLVDRVVPAGAVLGAAIELANECKPAQVRRKSCRIVAP
ncbi:enoyl-CoA hydratase-related protein [Saccharothrix sp. Mg75]|uniref:enoyl-CoA hydratase-related protein n=1 Tax=Saccharothrix sp. Mg75 TaxID=3445357 RepID=UPI003EE859B5